MADNLPIIQYDHPNRPGRRRKQWLIICLLVIAPLAGAYWGIPLVRPYFTHREYLRVQDEQAKFLLPPGTIVHTNDRSMIAALGQTGPIVKHWTSDTGQWETAGRIDRYQKYPSHRLGPKFDAETTGPFAGMLRLRSAGGTERIVRVGTQDLWDYPRRTGGPAVQFAGEIIQLAGVDVDSRQLFDHFPRHSVVLNASDRLTIYAAEPLPGDASAMKLPYLLNGLPGEFHVRLKDDGSVTVFTASGPAILK